MKQMESPIAEDLNFPNLWNASSDQLTGYRKTTLMISMFIRNLRVSKGYVSLALSCFAPISQNRVLSALFTMNGKLIRKTIAK